uniref:ORF0 n=1 Tax=Cereal yellow dwarf virus RPS TaxID=228582 RepID=A0A7R7TBA8_9VIRU|nr:ORF0 [Cereal yellow dwarf virus RPS]
MFVATLSGRVIVDANNRIYSGFVQYALFGLNSLFHVARSEYHYGPHEEQLFSVSLAYVLPLLLTGESHGRSFGLRLPISYYPDLLRWGLALGYPPQLTCSRRKVYIDLCTMSSQVQYRAELQRLATTALGESLVRHPRALLYGLRQFITILESSLRTVESNCPRIVWTSPVVRSLSVDKCIASNCAYCLLGRSRLLLTGRLSHIARYYNELDLQDIEVDFWYAAGISLHQAGEKYLQGSYLQKILQ